MIGQVCAFGVRAARCKFSFDQSLLGSIACRKDFFDTLKGSPIAGEPLFSPHLAAVQSNM